MVQNFGEGPWFDPEEPFVGVVEEVDEHEVEDDDDGEHQYFDEMGPVVGGFEEDGEQDDDEPPARRIFHISGGREGSMSEMRMLRASPNWLTLETMEAYQIFSFSVEGWIE